MADITIIRNGARISLANFPKLGSGSENIAVAVSASGAYDTYTTELYYGWYQGSSMQKMLAQYQNGLYYIPSNALFNAGNVYLTLRLVSGSNKVSTNTIPITIEKSAVNNEYSILPATETWQSAVDNYLNNSINLLSERFDNLNTKVENEIPPLKKRLDNIVASTGDSNTEIVDARLGADGVTYDTLGNAIRGQYNKLITKIKDTGDGILISAAQNSTTWKEFDIKTGDSYTIINNINGAINMSTNESVDGPVIEYITNPKYGESSTFTATHDAKYFRVYSQSASGNVIIIRNKTLFKYLEELIMTNKDFINIFNGLSNQFVKVKNMCYKVEQGYVYNAYSGVGNEVTKAQANGWSCCEVRLNGDEGKIAMSVKFDVSPFSYYADSNYKMISDVISHLVDKKQRVYTVPENARYLLGSYEGTDFPNGVVVIKGSKDIDSSHYNATDFPYNSYGVFLENINVNDSIKLNVLAPITVMKDGTGDFTKLTDAIKEAEKTYGRTVIVGAGTWDLIDELGNDYIESINESNRGVYLKNGIRLICSSRSVITCNYTGDNEEVKTWLSAFNAGKYGFTLENATIESSNCRYTIHDERDSDPDQYKNVYKNCFFTHTNGKMNQCIGGGLGLDGHVIIDGCKLISTKNGVSDTTLSYHNSGDGYWEGAESKGAQSIVEISNNYMNGTIAIQTFGQSTKDTKVLIHGNSTESSIVVPLEQNPVIKVTMWNNEVRQ